VTITVGLYSYLLNVRTESYGPVILARRAKELRASTGNPYVYAPMDLQKKGVKQMMTVTLARPVSRRRSFRSNFQLTCPPPDPYVR